MPYIAKTAYNQIITEIMIVTVIKILHVHVRSCFNTTQQALSCDTKHNQTNQATTNHHL